MKNNVKINTVTYIVILFKYSLINVVLSKYIKKKIIIFKILLNRVLILPICSKN